MTESLRQGDCSITNERTATVSRAELNIAGGKLRRLLLVEGERDGQQVKFNRVDCYENLHITRLIDELVQGKIAIDFDAREARPGSKTLRNHGTKFRVSPEDIGSLYITKTHLR